MLRENPLIDQNPSDTIENLHSFLELLCIALSNDDEVHPGYVLSVKTALSATKSLQNNQMLAPAGPPHDTQKV